MACQSSSVRSKSKNSKNERGIVFPLFKLEVSDQAVVPATFAKLF